MQRTEEKQHGMIRGTVWLVAAMVSASAMMSPVAAQSAAPPAEAGGTVARFNFDPAHTHLGFSVRHMMVTNVRGKFREFDTAMSCSTVPTRLAPWSI